ncbi:MULTISPECIES: UDP-N-acetylglucosamine 1-carboxyvinyltransferase [Limnochorda]|uniref:UDP-N-acetylglucosamine 1-carboxyvinyltransferase n=1 Tax=Limnochorda TaxID=1676651 RepID=UPI0017D094C4|nr:UDP-N-acetylglucosamine 1-carboxyvinyltransferase [Limnochorda pilosa]MBO2486374.1 UDP-N-acetylglucosamine 1-carboxyvinyltransferase [Bacillota bacterium]MBO2518773.1 UDP-N-acetylglucosamine 1-carboxyvinyltransferase [Bacillota bacterium]NMA70502.1 UDP-N-acetylglucosamine 1-carboxyvinyltransferase [Bacillota bacterium]
MSVYRIEGGRRLEGRLTVRGAKNASLKLMAAALMAEGPTVLEAVPRITDIETMISVLQALGAQCHWLSDHVLEIDPRGLNRWEPPDRLVRRMRASVQVMGPLLAKMGRVRLTYPGGCSIGARPIDLHLEGLRALGAEVVDEGGYVEARMVQPRDAVIHLDYPSVGATENLICAAALGSGSVRILNAAQEPEVAELGRFLNRMGARVRGAGQGTVEVEGVRRLTGVRHAVIPDRIEAGTYLLAGAITRGQVEVGPVVPAHVEALVARLEAAGCQLAWAGGRGPRRREGSLALEGVEGNPVDWVILRAERRPRPLHVRTQPHPGFPTDLQPQLMAYLSLADGTSLVTETVHTARFNHVDELVRMGASIQVEGRTAVIRGVPGLTGTTVQADDLRAGAGLVLAGLAAEGTTVVEGIEHIRRGYEDLAGRLREAGAAIEEVELEEEPVPAGV